MFERHLKIFLGFLVLAMLTLMVRAVYVQAMTHDYWSKRAAELERRVQTTETVRGRILDRNGDVLAIDVPCTDACVDYRAILDPPDPKWLSDLVTARLHSKLGKTPGIRSKQLREDETKQARADIDQMWDTLAELYRPQDDDDSLPGFDHRAKIEEIRQEIIQRVEMSRRMVWYRAFQQSQTHSADEPLWQQWLAGHFADGPSVDDFVTVADQTAPHVILHAIDSDTINLLGKRLEQFPGLVLRPSTHRQYPMKEIACHVLGRLSRASAGDLENSKNWDWDQTRQYQASDESGRAGIESLCEPLLRGSRGIIERRLGDDAIIDHKNFVLGQDISITIDARLQSEVQEMLKHVREKDEQNNGTFFFTGPELNMHAAAVVIDVKTSEVRVLASNPGFDVNDLESRYAALVSDRLDDPLRNRATCDEFEPGSTVKPMIGLSAITQGLLGPVEGIECTGYLELPVLGPDGRPTGKKLHERTGRCWVASEFAETLAKENPPRKPWHHIVPGSDPHRGHDGNPDGWLSYRDALERSCNVFFETAADRLGPTDLVHWYRQFGFGRITGVGIAERPGILPDEWPLNPVTARMTNCFAGIGQGNVLATPLQIANEAATIARDGIWMRPRLLSADMQQRLDAVRPRSANALPDAVDLHLDPEGLRQAKMGLFEVVNGGMAGTGSTARLDDIVLAGKTGTAQGAPILQKLHDQTGKVLYEPMPPATKDRPWYRSIDPDGKKIIHAWFMGYAPADHPVVAFCVLIEYAGAGGGSMAAPIADNILEACAQHGYPELRHTASLAAAQ